MNEKIIKNTNWLDFQAAAFGNSTAIIDSNENVTFLELRAKVIITANHLISLGIKKGTYCCILSENCSHMLILQLAIWSIGGVIIPLNYKLTENEISDLINHSCAEFVFINQNLLQKISNQNAICFPFQLEKPDSSCSLLPFASDEEALIIYTSGSTAKPKGVVHTFGSLAASFDMVDDFINHTKFDSWLASLPFCHIGGFQIFVRSLLAGAPIIFSENLSAESLCITINLQKPAYFSLVFAQFENLINLGLQPYKGLKTIFIGGGPASSEKICKYINDGWKLNIVYGSSETGSMVTVVKPKQFMKNLGSAGFPLKDVDVIINGDDENYSEILIKSPSLFKKYHKDEILTKSVFVVDFFMTGDLGYLNPNGYLFVNSRRSDIIISGGMNISIQEVETIISQFKMVKEVKVFALEDDFWGQVVTAAIVIKSNYTVKGINFSSLLQGRIAAYKIPKRYLFLSELPLTPAGKCDVPALKKFFQNL